MLAAIGHDLRTPLTTLRLRAELVEDPDLQERMLDTIDEMQAMTEATLSLARQETNAEPTRTIDLSALVESVCDDLAEIGQSVVFVGGGRVNYRCRPDGLRRTIRNLIENAVRYAGRAEVRLITTRSTVEIVVEDDGPGIPSTTWRRSSRPSSAWRLRARARRAASVSASRSPAPSPASMAATWSCRCAIPV